ncbi:hypothetical protein EV183_003911 [Coemansia sp. RSA 2336]|nr:hypothetical protein EV183_003911 [Coemansia sp. RSA 2336]
MPRPFSTLSDGRRPPSSSEGFRLAGAARRGRPRPFARGAARPPFRPAYPYPRPRPSDRPAYRPRPHFRPLERSRSFASKSPSISPTKPRTNAASADSDLDGSAATEGKQVEKLLWCEQKSQNIQMTFMDDWILGLVKNASSDNIGGGHRVVIPGLCPFHISTVAFPDGKTTCSGVNTHMHQQAEALEKISAHMPTLKFPLVTHPMPLSLLVKFPKLRAVSLYFYEDADYMASTVDSSGVLNGSKIKAKAHRELRCKGPEMLSAKLPTKEKVHINPVCHRMLQRLNWKLDPAMQFSLDNWTNLIDNNNVLLYARGMRVPRPRNPKYHAAPEVFAISIGFWTPFQQKMWEYYLNNNCGPCYLDAAYSCDKDGFQLWTLFFEREGQTVPLSYLVTTGVSARLVADWLEAIVDRSGELQHKIMFINSMRLMESLSAIFVSWDVRFGRYYVDQQLRELTLPKFGESPCSPEAVAAVQNINDNFLVAVAAAKSEPSMYEKAKYLFDQEDEWMPKTYGQVEAFAQSSQAVARWRYLLWMTMLSRPDTNRVDSVVYFLVSVLTVGVEQAIRERHASSMFDMSAVERGSNALLPELASVTMLPLDPPITCLISCDGQTKQIIDKHYGVCFCPKFVEHGMCEHLLYCFTREIHQPWLLKLMNYLPLA